MNLNRWMRRKFKRKTGISEAVATKGKYPMSETMEVNKKRNNGKDVDEKGHTKSFIEAVM
jgi:hypothetical protein